MIVKVPVCIDVSHWKEILDFNLVSPKPFLFITKATEGTGYRDDKFIRFFSGAAGMGWHRGAYHFHRKAYTGAAQAQHFCNFVRPHITPDDILILDVEEGGENASQLKAWFEYVKVQFPDNLLMIYSRANILNPIPMFMRKIFPALDNLYVHHPLNAIQMTLAERQYFRTVPVWTAGYPINPDLYNTVPASYIPDQTKWGPVWLWQYSDVGAFAGIDGSVDLNWMSSELVSHLSDVVPPPPPEDVVSHPFPGVTVTRGRRFGSDVQVLQMSKDSIASARAVWGGVGARVQDISGDIVVNGGDFDQTTFRAIGLLISDGEILSPQANYEPAFGMWPNGEAEISHFRTSWPNAIGLKRYIIANGQINQTTTDAWNERAPHTICCVLNDGSPLIFCSRGYQEGQAGLTLFECASVALEFGALWAGDGDGGYSTQMKIGNEVFGATTDRYDEVADFWSFNIKGETMAYPSLGNYKIIVAESTERSTPQLLSNNETGRMYHMGDVVEITKVQSNVPGVAEWGQLANGNWIATIYNSRMRVEFVSATTPPPPPPAGHTVVLKQFDAVVALTGVQSWTAIFTIDGVDHTFSG